MSSVEQDLNEAFAGESQAFQKYRAFAKKAARDGTDSRLGAKLLAPSASPLEGFVLNLE